MMLLFALFKTFFQFLDDLPRLVAIQIRSEEEREESWRVINIGNDWGKGRRDLSDGRMWGERSDGDNMSD